MNKKIYGIMIALILCVAALGACDSVNHVEQTTIPPYFELESSEGQVSISCKHSFSEWEVVSQATCNEDGQRVRACVHCLMEEYDSIPATTEHNAVVDSAVAPSCTQEGKTEGKHCADCGEVLVAQQPLASTSHNYNDEYDENCNSCGSLREVPCRHANVIMLPAVAPTCTEQGMSAGETCADCRTVLLAQNTVPPTNHFIVTSPAVAATCTTEGITEGSRCSLCGVVFSNAEALPMVEHQYDDRFDESCNVCGHVREADCPHSDLITLAASAASCTEQGLTEGKQCSKCNETVVAQEIIPALGHTAGDENKTLCVICGELIPGLYDRDDNLLVAWYMLSSVGMDVSEDFLTTTSNINYPSKLIAYYINYHFDTRTEMKLILPEGITRIGENAFFRCQGLIGVVLPDCVTEIADSAFVDCRNLESVTFSENLTAIGQNAFAGCISLGNVALPKSLNSIGDYAFNRCTSLTRVDFGSSIERIGNYAFNECAGILSLNFDNSAVSIGDYAFYNCDGITELKLPEGMTGLGDYAFYDCDGLLSVWIGGNVKRIGARAFDSCSALESVVIGDGVEIIGEGAFHYCKISSVTLPDTVLELENDAFSSNCFERIELPDSLERIGDGALAHCKQLASVTFPDSLKTIGKNAFENCISLTEITVPESVTLLDESAFEFCHALESVTLRCKSVGTRAFFECNALSEVHIESGVQSIGDNVFYGCQKITSVSLPDTLTRIGRTPFNQCDLESIEVDEANESFCSIDGILFNKDVTRLILYPKEKSGQYYSIPTTVTEIGNEAFYDSYVKYVVIPDGVTVIGESAFESCGSLQSIAIPDSVTVIHDSAFRFCGVLGSVTIGNSVERIGETAFYSCEKLSTIVIPESVSSIGRMAFAYCESLGKITIPANVTELGKRVFYETFNLTRIDVDPSNPVYCSIDGVLFDKNVTTLICYPTGREGSEYDIPDSVTRISEAAFYFAASLTDISMPKGLETIEQEAFFFAGMEESVLIPEGVTSIGVNAFAYCLNATEFMIPESVTYIGDNAFYRCDSLEVIYYLGTAEQWNALVQDLKYPPNAKTVCSDETIDPT
ncbi:MAG: leucine-rich repeat domain-containing protein [Clostridia bacterium]|nr:leucine-rich repeat domain-containing protein [Clostridia bacterium]